MPDESTNPRRRFLPRFSLRTLLIVVMLFAAGYGLWRRRDAWVLERHLNLGADFPENEKRLMPEFLNPARYWSGADFSRDRSKVLAGDVYSPKPGDYPGGRFNSRAYLYAEEARPALYSLDDGRILSPRPVGGAECLSPRGRWIFLGSGGTFASLNMIGAETGVRIHQSDQARTLGWDEHSRELTGYFLTWEGFALSPDERQAVYREGKDHLVVCDLETRATLLRLRIEPEESTEMACFSPGGRYLATGDAPTWSGLIPFIERPSKVVLWDLHSGERETRFASRTGKLGDFAPDDSKLIVYVPDPSVEPREGEMRPETGQLVELANDKVLAEWEDGVRLGPFSADGRRLLVRTLLRSAENAEGAADSEPADKLTVTVFDAERLVPLAAFPVRGHEVRFAPDDKKVLVTETTSSSFDREVMDVHDAATGARLCTLSIDHLQDVGRDRALVTQRRETDGTGLNLIHVRDLATGERLATLEGPPARAHYGQMPVFVCAAVFTEGDAGAWIARSDRTVQYWQRRRPEQWWGLAWLPEFWLTAVFGLALVWSLVRDFRTLRRAAA